MSYSGVTINGVNTLTAYGLALLADLTISEPEPRTTYVTVPEADGDLDLTGALTGGVVRYGMRQVSFTLYPVRDIIAGTNTVPTEEHAALVRQQLTAAIHGKQATLLLPSDPSHYFIGRLAVGDKGGFNDLRIPVTMTAQPWRINPAKIVTIAVPFTGDYTITNPGPATVPTFKSTHSNAAIFTFGSSATPHTIGASEVTFDDVTFETGENVLHFVGTVSYPVTIKYQEAVL